MGLTDKLDKFETNVETMVEKEEESKGEILNMLIDDLDLSARAYNSLKRTGVNTLEELTQKTEEGMIKLRNLGSKSLEEVKFKLKELGLSFRANE